MLRTISMLLLFVAAGACRRQVQVGSPPAGQAVAGVGGATARAALERFMAAAKAQDLDAMSLIWGTSSGPVRSTMSRQEWEMREVVFMRCVRHDSWRVLGETPVTAGERLMLVELKFRDLTRSSNFYAVPGPDQRWFIRQVDQDPLKAICQSQI